jgi:short-subunit dehydrogenase
MTLERAWLILGASSAIARAFARVAAEAGSDLVLAGRDLDDLGRTACDIRVRYARAVEVIAFDAADFDSHSEFVERVRSLARRLDVFLAFGLMPTQAEIDAEPKLALQTIAATYTGAVSALSRLAPVLAQQGEGRVVVLGSVAGDRGRLKNYVYGSAKAGLIDSPMTFGMRTGALMASPEACARACLHHSQRGREVAYFPPIWRLIMLIIREIPERLMKRLSF